MKTALDLLAQDEARSDRVVAATVRGAIREARSNMTLPGGLVTPSDSLLQAFGLSAKSGASVNENTAFNVSVFSACVNILAQSIAMLPLKLGRMTESGPVEQPQHPVARLLARKPTQAQTSYVWRQHKQVNVCLGGNGYSRVYRDSYFVPGELEPLKPCDLRPVLLSNRRIAYDLRGEQLLQDYEVVHVRALSSNGYTGRSPLFDMRESMGLSMTAQEYTSRTFANGNRKPGVFEGGVGTTPDKAKEFRKFWEDNYSGAMNAGRTPLLIGGVTWKESGFSNQDAELLMSRRFEVEEISRHFRVPLFLLNSTEKSTSWGTGLEQQNEGFVKYTLQPWLENWEEELEDKLLSEAEKNTGYFIRFDLDALLRGSPEQRAKFWEAMRRIRAVSVNEIRTAERMQILPDMGANNLDWPLNAQASGNAAPQAALTAEEN